MTHAAPTMNKKAMAEAMAKAQARGTKPDAREMVLKSRMSVSLSCTAHVVPFDIRCKFLAANFTASNALNCWGALGRKRLSASYPLVNCTSRNIEQSSHGSLPADQFASFQEWFIDSHVASV